MFHLFLLGALLLLCAATHLFLIPAGLGIVNSDTLIHALTIDFIRQGNWTPFQISSNYGGVSLSLFRVPWLWFFDRFHIGAEPHVLGHLSFSYLIVPALKMYAFYFLARSYASKKAALAVAILCAVDFNAYLFYLDSDFYNMMLISAALLLGIRARYKSPLTEMSIRQLIAVSILAGLSYYTYRASLIFVIAFFIPWSWAFAELKGVLSPKTKQEKFLIWAGVFFLGFYAYLEVFGGNLGTFFGRKIKLHAGPNLDLAAASLGVVWANRNWKKIAAFPKARIAALLGGFAIGMSPEFVFWLSQGRIFPATTGGTYGFTESLTAAGKIPGSLRWLVSAGEGVGSNISIILFCAAAFALARSVPKNLKLGPVVFSGTLALIAYVRLYTYDIAPPRYLSPVLPALIVGVAILFDWMKSKRLQWLAILLLAIHCWDQVHSRIAFAQNVLESDAIARLHEIPKKFREAQVDAVITDSYWEANTYTFSGNWNPIFVPYDFQLFIPPQGVSKALQSERTGILLTGKVKPPSDGKIEMLGRNWKLEPLAEVSGRHLYIGTSIH